MTNSVRAHALVALAVREPARSLLLASAAGWIVTAWLLAGAAMPHVSAGHAPWHFAAVWLAMITAMAPPLLIREIGYLWRTSLRRLRPFAISWFVFGYVGVWLLAGAALLWALEPITASPGRIAGTMALIALWLCSPIRQRYLNACHRAPTLRVFGASAQLDALRYGLSTGFYCVATCGALMLLVMLAKEHHLAAMAVATALTTVERHGPARQPRGRIPIATAQSPEWQTLTFGVVSR